MKIISRYNSYQIRSAFLKKKQRASHFEERNNLIHPHLKVGTLQLVSAASPLMSLHEGTGCRNLSQKQFTGRIRNKFQTSLNSWDKLQRPNAGPCDQILWQLVSGTSPLICADLNGPANSLGIPMLYSKCIPWGEWGRRRGRYK